MAPQKVVLNVKWSEVTEIVITKGDTAATNVQHSGKRSDVDTPPRDEPVIIILK